MFAQIPPRMAAYATYELVEKLLLLTPQQRGAIDRIVEHVFVNNRPISDLFAGERPICREDNYYRRGKLNEETGKWLRRPGWQHDRQFQDALGEAARLALQAKSRDEYTALAAATRQARLAAPLVVGHLVMVATDSYAYTLPSGEQRVINRMTEDRDSIAAAKVLLELAASTPSTSSGAGAAASEEDDWWRAAEDGRAAGEGDKEN